MNVQSVQGYKKQAVGFPESRLESITYNPHLLKGIKSKQLGSQKAD